VAVTAGFVEDFFVGFGFDGHPGKWGFLVVVTRGGSHETLKEGGDRLISSVGLGGF
jgi:hypothetical protein